MKAADFCKYCAEALAEAEKQRGVCYACGEQWNTAECCVCGETCDTADMKRNDYGDLVCSDCEQIICPKCNGCIM